MLDMQENSCPTAVGADGGWPTLSQQVAAERAAIAKSTDLALCDADPLGDGDQSPLRRALPGTPTQALVDVWCAGTWLGMLLTLPIEGRGADGSPPLPAAAADEIAPPFSWACARGKWAAVEAALAAAAGDADATRTLLETRATPIRMSALHLAVAGSREVGRPGGRPAALALALGMDHLRVVSALLAAGARVDARDIIGQTPWHHALTGTWSPVSLAAAQLLLRSGGVCANARNRCGRTVLVELAMVGPAAMPAVQLALEAGADWSIADSDGNTPRRLAVFFPLFTEAAAAAAVRKRGGANRTLEGARVRVHGLRRAEELNGKTGVAGAFDPARARYALLLDGAAEPLSVAAANLVPADARERVCAACDADSLANAACARCLAVYYCNAACQKTHWPAHKPACKPPAPSAPAHVFVPQPPRAARGTSELSSAPGTPLWRIEALGAGKVIVKVQGPLYDDLDPDAARAPLAVYDEARKFVAMIPHTEPAHAALTVLLRLRPAARKVYVLAWKGVQEGQAGVFFRTDADVEAQRW
jgi:hypothetical protein